MPVTVPKSKAPANPMPAAIGMSTGRKPDTHEKLVTVYDPEGKPQRMQRHQANDLVRHCGWKNSPPGGVKVLEPDKPEGEDAKGEAASKEDTKPKEPDEVDTMRALLKEAGVEVDLRWGKKKLQEELDKLVK